MRGVVYRMLLLGALSTLTTAGCTDAQQVPTGAGSRASDYLLNGVYTNVRIEADLLGSVVGDPLVRDVAVGQVRKMLAKPGQVDVVVDRPEPSHEAPVAGYSLEDIEALERQYRGVFTQGDTASIYVIYLPGHYHQDTEAHRVFGAAYGATSMVVFAETVAESCAAGTWAISDPEVQELLCPLTEAATWVHEFGHIIGLVDNGTPMVSDHLDEAHGKHDTNENCIMHWSHESSKLANFIEKRLQNGNTSLDVFDQACKDDIDAFRATAGAQ